MPFFPPLNAAMVVVVVVVVVRVVVVVVLVVVVHSRKCNGLVCCRQYHEVDKDFDDKVKGQIKAYESNLLVT